MKKTYYFLLTLTALLLSAVNVGAQLVPAADNNSYYYIQFRHNATDNAVMEDMGSGNVMKAKARTLGKDAQLWRVTAGVTQGSYVFTSKLGNKIVWDGSSSRYKTSSTGTGADIKLLYSNNATYPKSFELQRVGSTQAFNVWGGVAINNEIAEYYVGDAGGTVIFVRAPEISSIDNSAEHWYWLKNYRDNGKTVNTSNVGANFDPVSPATFRKFKVVKDAVNTTYGLVYLDGSNFTYLQAGTGDAQDPAPFNTTSHTGFSPFTPTATAGTGSGSAAGIRGWRIFRPGSSFGMFHMKVVGGGYSLRYNNTGVEDANVWSFFDAKDVLGEKYSEAIEIHKSAPEGTGFGQYSSETKAVLQSAISTAEGIYNNPSSTQEDLLGAYTSLNNALTSLYASSNSSLNSLLSANPDNNRWYRLKNRNYTTNDFITSNTVAENGGIITQNSGTANDNELWRFELNAGGTAVKIVNKATGLAIKENGQSTQSTLVNLSTATEFVFSRQDIYWAIGRVNATQYQYLHRDGSSRLVGWEATASASHWTLQYVEETPKATRTLTVAAANPGLGTAVITGTENTSATTYNPISATATATDPNYFFTNWTNAVDGAVVSTSNPFVYTGTEDLEIRANFATNGIPVAPMASTTEHPVYYLIQSASNATHSFSSYTGDFRGNVLISPTEAGKLIHNKLSTATTADHALWQIVNVEGVQLLKNKATGFYMTGSHSVGATGAAANAFTFDLINGSTTQYKLRTADASGSYINTWQNNLADRLNTGDQANSLIAWYFIAPAFTGTSDFSNTADWTNGVVPADSMAIAINSDAIITDNKTFNGLHIADDKTLTVNAGKGLTIHNSITGSGTLKLLSDATNGTATLVGNVGGNAIVEQAVESSRNYYVGVPIDGAVVSTGIGNKVATFTESTDLWTDYAEAGPLTSAVAGHGYLVQVPSTFQLISFSGTLNNGDKSATLSSSKRRFNFLGNPYPSYVDGGVLLDGLTVEQTLWYYSKEGTGYTFKTVNTSTNVSTDNVDKRIAPMQGFWVRANVGTTPTVSFNNTNRMHKPTDGNANIGFRAPQATDYQMLRLQVSNNTLKDVAIVMFSENSTSDWSSSKMMNPSLNVYTLVNGNELAINSNTAIPYDVETTVGLQAPAGEYTISATEFSNFSTDKVYLLDKVTGISTDLSSGGSYTVNLTADYKGTDRFALVFPRTGVSTGLESAAGTTFAFIRNNRVVVNSDALGSTVYVFNGVGQQVASQAITGATTEVSKILSAGVYVVKVNNDTVKVVVK